MAKSVELYTTDFALEAQGASYKGLIIVNKVRMQACRTQGVWEGFPPTLSFWHNS